MSGSRSGLPWCYSQSTVLLSYLLPPLHMYRSHQFNLALFRSMTSIVARGKKHYSELPYFFVFIFDNALLLLTRFLLFSGAAGFLSFGLFLTRSLSVSRALTPLSASAFAFFFASRLATRSASVALTFFRSSLDSPAIFVPRAGSPFGTGIGVAAGRGRA